MTILLTERSRRRWLWLIVIGLALMPLILWGREYAVGGDDTRLYYIYPFEYLTRFTPNLISDNQLSALGYYFSQLYIAPFVLLVLMVKTILPFVQTANLMYGLDIAAGFLGFYYLLGLWFKTDSRSDYLIKVIAALFYVGSTFTTFSIWQNQLFVVYLVGVLPWVIFLFLKGVRESDARPVVVSALLLSLFSVVIVSVPWFAAAILAIIPILVVEFWANKRIFLKSLGLFLGLLILINLYWLFHFVYSPRSSNNPAGSIVGSVTTDQYREANVKTITQVSDRNSLLYPALGLFHNELQSDNSWRSYGFYANWNRRFMFWGAILPLIALAPLVVIKKKEPLSPIYRAALISWLAMLFLFTVNIGEWGTVLFVWLNNVLPGFVMFRNMYDKLGLALGFSYAFLIAIGLKIIFAMIKQRRVRWPILAVLLVFILIQARPFIFGAFYGLPIWTTKQTIPSVQKLNSDFLDLTADLNNLDKSRRLVWLPLNRANYVFIQDQKNPNHYYSGVSPIQFLAGINDLNGWLSFSDEQRVRVFDAIERGDTAAIGEELRQLNVGYVILNHDIGPDIQNSYLYRMSATERPTVFEQQTAALMASLVGEKIRDYGSRYSLYKINERFANERIYATGGAKVTFERQADYQYKIHLSELTSDQSLVFLDPYHKQWRLTDANGRPVSATHEEIYGYANVWRLRAAEMGGEDVDLTLTFQPHRYSNGVNVISALTLLLAVTYLWRRRRVIPNL